VQQICEKGLRQKINVFTNFRVSHFFENYLKTLIIHPAPVFCTDEMKPTNYCKAVEQPKKMKYVTMQDQKAEDIEAVPRVL